MPFPRPTDPFYCQGSGAALPDGYDHELLWHRCPFCGRLIAEAGHRGVFHAHKNVPGRKGDDIQETLTAHGFNRRDRLDPPRYADPDDAAPHDEALDRQDATAVRAAARTVGS